MPFYSSKIDLSHYSKYEFDQVFSSRTALDKAAALGTDGLFAGRFALVSYQPDPATEFKATDIILGYLNSENGYIYADKNKIHPYIYTEFTPVDMTDTDFYKASNYYLFYYYDGKNYIHLESENQFVEGNTNYYTANISRSNIVSINQLVRLVSDDGFPSGSYYRCVGSVENQPAIWTEVILGAEDDSNYQYPDYLINFNLDRATYGESFDARGYDSTVWQKVYSDGYGKFIFISRLSASMPAIELFPDPPSELPKAPYIDALSSDSFYRIHVPSKFGFQIKEAGENELSDQNMTVTRYSYDPETGVESSYQSVIPAAIYFNKDGSNKAIHNYDSTTNNEILLTPTGESGKKYYDINGNLVTKDMLELTIHAPAIGNMVADGYDLIYGFNNNNNTRPLDIQWKDGLQSDTEKKYGDPGVGGKARNLSTLAGTLNIMHDLLGQIVVEDGVLDPTTMRYDLIYKNDGRYYRRTDSGKVIAVAESDYTYRKIDREDLESTCPYNKYFEYQGTSIPSGVTPSMAIEFKEDTSYNYFLKSLRGIRYHEIIPHLESYTAGRYYRKLGTDYILDTSQIPLEPDTRYWEITPQGEPKHFYNAYSADGTFFTYDDTTAIYTPTFSDTPQPNIEYSKVYASGTAVATDVIYYRPGIFFYQDALGNYILEMAPQRNLDHAPYYRVTFKDELNYGQDANGNAIQYRVMDQAIQITNLRDAPDDINTYYFQDAVTHEWIPYSALGNMDLINGESPYSIARTYYKLTVDGPYTSEDLFLPRLYYELQDGNYILSLSWKNEVTDYYSITATQLPQVFYIPDKYWYERAQDDFAIAVENTMVHSTYYRKTGVYVDHDSAGQCPHGYEWNDYSLYIPPSISLYYKTEEPDKEELTGIENGNCSIYGSLLELHKQLDFNNLETRKTSTFRGCFNALNDMLYRIKELKPDQILTVNNFGQIVSMSLSDLKAKLNALP